MTSAVRTPGIIPQCEHPGCLAIPDLAPRIYCPAKGEHRHPAVTLAFPHLHYCKPHWDSDVKLDNLMDDKVKARIEHRGRKIWPQGIVPDFDAALLEPLGIWTPEYAAYMRRLGFETDGLGFSMWQTMERRNSGRTLLL